MLIPLLSLGFKRCDEKAFCVTTRFLLNPKVISVLH